MVQADPNGRNGVLVLVGIAQGDPNAVLVAVDDAMQKVGASITDVHFFSGIQVTLHFEVASEDLPALGEGLLAAGVRLDAQSLAGLRAASDDPSVAGTLAITLMDGDPNLKRTIPAVPG